jgi:hypothetical protein
VNLVSTDDEPAWKVTFPSDGDVDVPAEQEVQFRWEVGSAPFRAAITAVTFVPEWPGQAPSAANNWTTTDVNNLGPNDPPVSWEYTVTITYQGTSYSSDPKITNDPPTHIFHRAPSGY